MNLFASVAVVTMINGKANGILEGWGKCDDIEWQGNCIHAGLVEVSLGIISCVEVGITASCSLFKIFQGFIIFFLRICFSSCKALNINTPQKRKRTKETNWKQKFQKPQNENICLTYLNTENKRNFHFLSFRRDYHFIKRCRIIVANFDLNLQYTPIIWGVFSKEKAIKLPFIRLCKYKTILLQK